MTEKRLAELSDTTGSTTLVQAVGGAARTKDGYFSRAVCRLKSRRGLYAWLDASIDRGPDGTIDASNRSQLREKEGKSVSNIAEGQLPTHDRPAARDQRRFGAWGQLLVLFRLKPREIGSLLVRAYNDWSADGASRLGAALAYYTLFSIAPILVVVTGIAGLFIGQAAARGEVAPWLERLVSPQGAQAAELMLTQSASPAGGIITTLGGLMALFFGTSALVNELRQSLNLVWRVRGAPAENMSILAALRGMLSARLYAFVLVISAGLLVLLSLVVNTVVAVAGAHFQSWLPMPAPLLQMVDFMVSYALMATMITLVYRVVPDADVTWGDAWVGALVTAAFVTLGSTLLSTFVGKAATSVYGSAASVLALLAWVFYSAQVFFYGAELTRIFANEYGGRIVPHYHSVRSFLPARP
jgi:membrane protein